jgi:hypothetical protein
MFQTKPKPPFLSKWNVTCHFNGLYYKHFTIVNEVTAVSDAFTVDIVNDTSRCVIDDSRVALQIVASLTDDSRGVIYDRNVFILQATGFLPHFFINKEVDIPIKSL